LRGAVQSEKKRLCDAGTPKGTAKTELGKQIQRRMGASSVVADHYADQIAENILEDFDPKGEKPNFTGSARFSRWSRDLGSVDRARIS